MSKIVIRFVNIARYNFFLSNDHRNSSLKSFKEVNTVDAFIGIITFFTLLLRHLFSFFSDGLILISCLSLWYPTRKFTAMINTNISYDDIEVSATLKSYELLKSFSKQLNQVFALVLMFYLAESIFFYSISLNVIFVAGNIINKARAISFFFMLVAILFFSGDIGLQVI